MHHLHHLIKMLLVIFFLASPSLAALVSKRDVSDITQSQPSTLRITHTSTGPIDKTSHEVSLSNQKRDVNQDELDCGVSGLAPVFDVQTHINGFENARQKFCANFAGTKLAQGQRVSMHIDGLLKQNGQPTGIFVGESLIYHWAWTCS